jgi:hypothetical protein
MSNNNDTTWTGAQTSNKVVNEEVFDDYSAIMKNPWDPSHCADWDMQQPSATCLARIRRYRFYFTLEIRHKVFFLISDISGVFKDPSPGMFITPDPDNITKV